MFKEKLETNRSKIMEKVRPELMQSVVNIIRREKKNPSSMVQNRLNGNFDTLSERQNRQLRNCFQSNVEIMDGGQIPKFVLEILSLGPMDPVRAKIIEVHFFAHVDKLVRELRENKTEGVKLYETEASAKWYATNVR